MLNPREYVGGISAITAKAARSGEEAGMSNLNWLTKACAVIILWAATAAGLSAQTFTTLHKFNVVDGQGPAAGLVQAANGGLYGTTDAGGASGGFIGGTVFAFSSNGALTTLYSFCANYPSCPSSSDPQAALIQGSDGNLYGTTFDDYGPGTVFKITPEGTLTTLIDFDGPDGSGPWAGLVQGGDGHFYGTTRGGGSEGSGTVFRITPGGMLTTLYSFCSQANCADGYFPDGTLIQGIDGNFYGTASVGGANGDGTVFRITPTGALTTLHSFDWTDGAYPQAGLTIGPDGSLYGTTQGGGNAGCIEGCGTIFRITYNGQLTTLYSFCSQINCMDGASPQDALELATDGNFYGMTLLGGGLQTCEPFGDRGCGTIFKITPTGSLNTLHTFCSQISSGSCTDGLLPDGGVVQDTNGGFYGTTWGGGKYGSDCEYGCGTIFNLSVGLGPFVRTNPVAGKVGATVGILGTDLTGATGVKFNGTETAFRVVSSTFIEAKVPSGATTGTVQVQLPGGTLSSNVPFIVLR